MSLKTGYCNGSDILITVNGKAIGSCTSHTASFSSETKDRAVKPVKSNTSIGAGLWKGKTVVGLSVSISAEGLRFYDETESGFRTLFKLWKKGEPVELQCLERAESDPYMSGSFVISSLEESAPAQDDATYSVSFENDGEPSILNPDAITGEGGSSSPSPSNVKKTSK